MERSPDVTRISRRRLILLAAGGVGLGLTACLRRDVSSDAAKPAATQAPAAQAKPADAPKPAEAKPAESKPAAAAPPAAAPAKPTEAPKPAAAGTPKRGGTITLGVQNDWLTFDTAINSSRCCLGGC